MLIFFSHFIVADNIVNLRKTVSFIKNFLLFQVFLKCFICCCNLFYPFLWNFKNNSWVTWDCISSIQTSFSRKHIVVVQNRTAAHYINHVRWLLTISKSNLNNSRQYQMNALALIIDFKYSLILVVKCNLAFIVELPQHFLRQIRHIRDSFPYSMLKVISLKIKRIHNYWSC